MKTREEIIHEFNIKYCKSFHNYLLHFLAEYRDDDAIHAIIEPEFNQLYRIADLIADKVFPHNHEQ